MRGRACLALAATAVLGVALSAPAKGAAAAPKFASARLEGKFLLTGRITVAKNVRGERSGQTVVRTWTFTPTCLAGACATVTLDRTRSGGTDRLALQRRAPGYYSGRGIFYAPLSCGSKTYARGQSVPFKITVRITAATVKAGVLTATRVRASYRNTSRTNLTPCVAVLGHDAARYSGRLA